MKPWRQRSAPSGPNEPPRSGRSNSSTEVVTTALAPGSTIGIVGGGQLGRMLAQSARQHGYGVVVLTGGAEKTPAGVLADREITGAFDDPATVAAVLQICLLDTSPSPRDKP